MATGIIKNPIEVVVFGSGNVGKHLISEFKKYPDKIRLKGVWTRTFSNLPRDIPIITDLKKIPPADIYILALKDDVIENFSKNLSHSEVLTVHTSGVLPLDKLHVKRKGYFYPLQSFRKEKKEYDWKEIPVFIQAENEKDLNLLENLAKILTPKVYRLKSGQKQMMHVAAVFANNFSNLMFTIAHDLMQENKLPFDLLLPLIKETVERLENFSPRDSQTGPARRKDTDTIVRHMALLENSGKHREAEIYKILTDYLLKLYR